MVVDDIKARLQTAFHPVSLEVEDESHRHIGHIGARPGGETHFRVRIVAEAFRGLPRVQAHRLVYDALGEQMRESIHALAIEAKAP